MGVLADWEIIKRCEGPTPMIDPFIDHQVRVNAQLERAISYGLTSYGYDIRIADEFQIFHNAYGDVIDPKNFDPKSMLPFKGRVCRIPPNSFVLARTMERFIIPRDVQTIVQSKSTYARCGIALTVTPFEPEWEGYATIEISNLTPLPALVYAFEGIGQIIFIRCAGVKPCQVSYKDRAGKYQDQAPEIVPARL